MAKKDYACAALEFRSAAQAMANDPEPYYQWGLASLGAGDGNTAIQAVPKTVQLNPKRNDAQLKLAEWMLASRPKDLVEQAASNLSGYRRFARRSGSSRRAVNKPRKGGCFSV